MKTAMQELLDKIENKNGKEFTSYYTEFINEALEKEKEQIIKAVRVTSDNIDNIVPKMFIHRNFNAEEYYNQTYNQNK